MAMGAVVQWEGFEVYIQNLALAYGMTLSFNFLTSRKDEYEGI